MHISSNKKYHKNTPNNIAYIRGDILQLISSKISQKNSGDNILIPECYSLDEKNDSRFSQQLFLLFPELKINFDMYRKLGNKNYATVQFVDIYNIHGKNFSKVIFANMICKKQNYRQIDYIALAKTMEIVNNYLQLNEKNNESISIVSPKFGVGKSGGNWLFIESLIEDAWNNRSVQIYYGNN